jgi:hypothetical protein
MVWRREGVDRLVRKREERALVIWRRGKFRGKTK